MTTLVTGATGFVGEATTMALLARGDQVRALVRDINRAEKLRQCGAELAVGCMEDIQALRRAVYGVDHVYHCAAMVGDWLRREEIQRVNVDGTRNLLSACSQASIDRLIYLSSLAVLGAIHHYDTDETAPYCYTGDAYSDAKIDSERLVRDAHERGDVETVILRPGFIYGPGDRRFLPSLVDSIAKGGFAYVGDGNKILNIIYIKDVVQAALLADTSREASGKVYNLTDGTKTTLREFVSAIAEYVGVPAPSRSIPIPVAQGACYTLEFLARLTRAKAPPVLNRGRMKFLYYNQHYSIEAARRDLGFTPKFTYREGLPLALAWLRESGQLSQVPSAS